MLKYFEINKSFMCSNLFRYYIKQIDSLLLWVFSVIDHRRHQNVVRTSVTHLAIASCATFLFIPHFDVICDLLLNRCSATWNLFVKYIFLICFGAGSRQYCLYIKSPLDVTPLEEIWEAPQA